jgi:hypothetical protein
MSEMPDNKVSSPELSDGILARIDDKVGQKKF